MAASTVSPLSPEKYGAFIRGIELHNVRLVRLELDSKTPRAVPGKTSLEHNFQIEVNSERQSAHEFEMVARLELSFIAKDDPETRLGHIHAAYALTYRSAEELSPELLEVFGKQNVPINAWPYLRELVQTSMQRMDWPIFVLPPYKVLGREAAPSRSRSQPRAPRKASSKQTT